MAHDGVPEAVASLKDAIALHVKHMNGTAPTTGAAGERSQTAMMTMMKAALAALTSDDSMMMSNPAEWSRQKMKAKKMGGM
jgi:hypothetical protein